MTYLPIENYGIIGNMRTAALVGTHGSIDWLCVPYFDSPSVFAAILDDDKGGRFEIAPKEDGTRGTLAFRVRCHPAFDYARMPHRTSTELLAWCRGPYCCDTVGWTKPSSRTFTGVYIDSVRPLTKSWIMLPRVTRTTSLK